MAETWSDGSWKLGAWVINSGMGINCLDAWTPGALLGGSWGTPNSWQECGAVPPRVSFLFRPPAQRMLHLIGR